MAKYKIERKTFQEHTKGWEMWKDVSYEDRLAALQKIRILAFQLKGYGEIKDVSADGKYSTRKT